MKKLTFWRKMSCLLKKWTFLVEMDFPIDKKCTLLLKSGLSFTSAGSLESIGPSLATSLPKCVYHNGNTELKNTLHVSVYLLGFTAVCSWDMHQVLDCLNNNKSVKEMVHTQVFEFM